jgi:Glutamate-cysteine ligase
MDKLNDNERRYEETMEGCSWVPEYGAWMVEATPRRPYTGYTSDLLRVERSMRLRRMRLLTSLKENEAAPTVTAYFMLGAQGNDGTVPQTTVGGPVTLSDYISDDIINPHPRFGTLTANIRQRRGSKVNIRVPLYRDSNTPEYSDYDDKPAIGSDDGCCGGDSQQLWRYGKGDASMERYGKDFVAVGCSKSSVDEEFDDAAAEQGLILQKWLVDVRCPGCKGLFYRRSPGEIVPDADWPRNGDVVVGYEVQDTPGWIRLQNGYYLPIQSTDGKIQFLHKVSLRYQTTNAELKRIGSAVPLFRPGNEGDRSAGASNHTSPQLTPVVPTTLESLLNDSIDLPNEPTTSNHIETPDEHSTTTATSTSTDPPSSTENLDKERVRPAIHMDAMAFGMGNACLQITFQGKDIDESRIMFDQLAVMAPIMMALTAATPIVKGRIADTDARWGIISESVDCRTPAERGRKDPLAPYPEYNAKGERRIYKSRYDSISTFIYQGSLCRGNGDDNSNGVARDRVLNIYNDIPVKIDKDSYKLLRDQGIDPALAQHIAHLFIRDPLVVFNGAVEEVDDETQTEHFESIQSTNWQTVRWKPPPPRNGPNDPHIGWRTEFRSMELQLTDFENAAYTAFTVLLTRVILAFDLNLYIPLSKVDANMQRAHSRNAAANGRFYFRRHLAPLEEGDDGYGEKYVSMFSRTVSAENSASHSDDTTESTHQASTDRNGVSNARLKAPTGTSSSSEENSYEEMTMKEIMCGKGNYFPGLIPLIYAYLDHINCDDVTRDRISLYLDYIERKARGELVTTATWMRNFVRTHPAYKFDSIVTDEIAYVIISEKY